MTTKDPSRFVLVSKALRRSGLFLPLALAAGAIAGCGSNSSSGDSQPFPEFEGVWVANSGDDTSSLNCPMEVGLENVPFQIYGTTTTIEAGVLTDLAETDSACLFNYDVMGKIATIPATDPYTGKAPTCTINLSDGMSTVVLDPNPSPVWTFKLLAPVTGQAPTAQIVGAAAATVSLAVTDSSGNPTGQLQTLTPCTFAAQVNIHKIAKP